MKAAVIERQGSIDNLSYRDWPDPTPEVDEVLLSVRAVGLNHLDIFARRGMPGVQLAMPFISGGDIAGVIHACGAQVQGWRPGDRVAVNPITRRGMIGEEVQGGMAEYICVPQTNLVRLPAEMSFATAAAIPINFGTALRMLETIGQLQRGERVLIVGASGGVGTACVQLAKHLGAEVLAVTRGPEKSQSLRALGADLVIDSAVEDFSACAWRWSGKRGVDMVINYTGGDTWVPSLRALRPGGRLITCGATASYDPKTDIRYIWTRELRILGANGYTQSDIERSFELVAQGNVAPLIANILDMSQVRAAHALLESRAVVGKIVLTFSNAHTAT